MNTHKETAYMTTVDSNQNLEPTYHEAKSIRDGIARELARLVDVTPELVRCKRAADKALSEYRKALRDAVGDMGKKAFR